MGVGRVSEDAWNCLAHSQLAETHAVAVKKQNSSCELDGLCLCPKAPNSQTPMASWFGIESFGCPCQVVDVPQIEYEDKVVEVPVQKHVQAATGQTLGSWEPVGRGRECCTT